MFPYYFKQNICKKNKFKISLKIFFIEIQSVSFGMTRNYFKLLILVVRGQPTRRNLTKSLSIHSIHIFSVRKKAMPFFVYVTLPNSINKLFCCMNGMLSL